MASETSSTMLNGGSATPADGLFRRVVDASPAGVVLFDSDGRIVFLNLQIERLLGYSREDLIGEPVEAIVPSLLPADAGTMREMFAGSDTSAPGSTRELHARDASGSDIPVEVGVSLVATGDVTYGFASIVDIRSRRRAQARFRVAVEASPHGMMMVDSQGRIVLVNLEIERLFGYRREELLGQSVELLVPARMRADHPSMRHAFLADPQRRPMGAGRDLFGRRKDGTELPVEIGLNPFETEDGMFVLASVVDIGARKHAEEELRRSNEELERFAYVASHDLQEPLRTVASFVQLLERRYRSQLDSDAIEFIEFAVGGVTRMQRLIEELLAFSRVGTRGGSPVPTSAEAVLRTAVDNLFAAVEESGALITHDPLPEVLVDPRQFDQLLTNLIGNAIRFRGTERPAIHVSARRDGPAWRFSVRDNGIGIDPKYFDRIFVIFQRLHGRDEYPGTGMGLAICKKIVERHGGRIWVESAHGAGANFLFTLPALPE